MYDLDSKMIRICEIYIEAIDAGTSSKGNLIGVVIEPKDFEIIPYLKNHYSSKWNVKIIPYKRNSNLPLAHIIKLSKRKKIRRF
ncbi:MAG TPA: hypothetical protein ENH46_02680 [Candidatus Pacearchaeota archaeon]|nr:hypothetical protein [Candidatus Pacearchaeota archaeon]